MIVFHGSDTIVDEPVILQAKRPLDFGGGFTLPQAENKRKIGR